MKSIYNKKTSLNKNVSHPLPVSQSRKRSLSSLLEVHSQNQTTRSTNFSFISPGLGLDQSRTLEPRQIQIYSWIIEYAAYKDWDYIVDEILETHPDLPFNEVISARIKLNLARHYAHFPDKLDLVYEILGNTLEESFPSFGSIQRFIKIQKAITLLSNREFSGFEEQVKSLLLENYEQPLDNEFEEIIQPKISSQTWKTLENTLISKYTWEKFQERFNRFMDEIDKALPSPLLLTVHKDYRLNYKPSMQINLLQLRDTFEGDDEEFRSIWTQENQEIRNFKTQKLIRRREDHPIDKLSSIINQLEFKMKALNEHGVDPLEKALQEGSSEKIRKKNNFSPPAKIKDGKYANKSLYSAIQRPLLLSGYRKRKRWSEQEIDNLYEGIARFGFGNWSDILNHYNFDERNSLDLRDKWRNIEKIDPEGAAEKIRILRTRFKSLKNQNKSKTSKKKRKDESDEFCEEESSSDDE